MTLLTSDSQDKTAMPVGGADETSDGDGTPQVVGEGVPALKSPSPATRSRRAPDYRLRGLDTYRVVEVPPPSERHERPNRQRRRRLLVEWVVVLAVVALVAVPLRAWVFLPYSVSSGSMAPTFQPGDQILAVSSRFWPEQIKTGDIVVFRRPEGYRCEGRGTTASDLVERVIGLPGQAIWSADDTIYINGRVLNEPGWYNPLYGQLGTTPIGREVIPKDDYYLMADNRIDACDSRAFGAVPRTLIVGQVVALVLRNGHPHVHLY